MIALGFLLILVGAVLMGPRSGGSGTQSSRFGGSEAPASRFASIGWMHMPISPDRAYDGKPTRRNRLIQMFCGLVMLVGGIVIIAMDVG